MLCIDHYLGKESVQNLIVLPFMNSLFEPLWNANVIDHVEITGSEAIGSDGAPAITTKPAPCATWRRTVCCSFTPGRSAVRSRHRPPLTCEFH